MIKILDQLHNVTPEKLWITEMNYDKSGVQSGSESNEFVMKLELKGESVSTEEISIFVNNLEKKGFIKNLNMEESHSSPLSGDHLEHKSIWKFRLTGQIRSEV